MPPEDYRDTLLGSPRPTITASDLALALEWQPVYLAPLTSPAYWYAPDGTRHDTLAPDALLAEVRALAATREAGYERD